MGTPNGSIVMTPVPSRPANGAKRMKARFGRTMRGGGTGGTGIGGGSKMTHGPNANGLIDFVDNVMAEHHVNV